MWTQPEIKQYVDQARSYAPLARLYEEQCLQSKHAEARARFLAEVVLELTPTDHDVIMRTASAEGRAAGLLELEDMVIAYHTKKIEEVKEKIPVPV